MEIRSSHLRYLLAIYELSHQKADVGIAAIAKTLGCSKASVTTMMATLMEMGLLVKERYGKIYLTDTGFLKARELYRCAETIKEGLPQLIPDLTENEKECLSKEISMLLPSHCMENITKNEENSVKNKKSTCKR